VSLLYSERLRILLAERSVRVLRVGPRKSGVQHAYSFRLDTPASPGDVATVLGAVRAWLEALPARRRALDLVLSDALVRYAVVPWSDLVRTPAQSEQFARLILEPVLGSATDWHVRCSPAGYRQAYLACALPCELLRQIDPWPADSRATVVRSVTPLFMQVFNDSAVSLPDEGMLIINGPDRCMIAGWRARVWQGIRPYPVQHDASELLALTRREQLMHSLADESPVSCADLSGDGLLESDALQGFVELSRGWGSVTAPSAGAVEPDAVT
jgi:hypothetical protein